MKSAKLILLLVFCAAAVVSQERAVIIQTSTLLDGRGHLLRDMQIVVQNGKILRVEKASGKATTPTTTPASRSRRSCSREIPSRRQTIDFGTNNRYELSHFEFHRQIEDHIDRLAVQQSRREDPLPDGIHHSWYKEWVAGRNYFHVGYRSISRNRYR